MSKFAVRLINGDCLAELPRLAAEGVVVDSIVCDPPYHLSEIPHVASGGFNRTRTPRIQAARTGFMGQKWDGGDIAFRPETWATAASVLRPGGFLLAFGGTRTYHRLVTAIEAGGFVIQDAILWLYGSGFPKRRDMLKPAVEIVCVAYKPGGKRTLQVDECRVGLPIDPTPGGLHRGTGFTVGRYTGEHIIATAPAARWPANVCHDGSDEVMEAFAAFGTKSSGVLKAGTQRNSRSVCYGKMPDTAALQDFGGDNGSAARFFYNRKAAAEDRWGSRHPTVKPVELMKWLVALVTPPGGVVLDPFAGSGTTGVAAMATGRNAILIEREVAYCDDIRERLAHYDGKGRHSLASKARNRTTEPLGGLFATSEASDD